MSVSVARVGGDGAGAGSAVPAQQPHLLPGSSNTPGPPGRRDAKLCLLLVALLGVYYGLLQNGCWSSGSDSEIYLSLARNLVNGKGYVYMGITPAKIPPGWPFLLAGAMKLSASFWLMNAIPAASMLGAAALWYFVLRRLTTPPRSFAAVLVAGMLFPCYRLTFLAFSEGVFCLLATSALLLAMQINENRLASWRLPLLLALCVAMTLTRWTGVLSWLLVGGALVSGERGPRVNVRWIALALSGTMVVGIFFALRAVLEAKAAADKALLAAGDLRGIMQSWTLGISEAQAAGGTALRYVQNLMMSGSWLSTLFWEPSELAVVSRLIDCAVDVIGWLLIGCVVVHLAPALRARQWAWLGMGLLCVVLFARWLRPVSRYLIPVAPMLVLAAWLGIERLGTLWKSPRGASVARWASGAFLLSVIVCNLAIYAMDVWVARSSHFAERYQAGQGNDLIAAARYLNEHGLRDGQAAVNSQFISFGKPRRNTLGMRMLNLLTDRSIKAVPRRQVPDDAPGPALLAWARQAGVRYYVRRPPVDPWRLYHFRVPWLQQKLAGKPAAAPAPFFELYELRPDQALRIDLRPAGQGLRQVPFVRP